MIIEVVDDDVNRFVPAEPVHKYISLLPEVYRFIDRCT